MRKGSVYDSATGKFIVFAAEASQRIQDLVAAGHRFETPDNGGPPDWLMWDSVGGGIVPDTTRRASDAAAKAANEAGALRRKEILVELATLSDLPVDDHATTLLLKELALI